MGIDEGKGFDKPAIRVTNPSKPASTRPEGDRLKNEFGNWDLNCLNTAHTHNDRRMNFILFSGEFSSTQRKYNDYLDHSVHTERIKVVYQAQE